MWKYCCGKMFLYWLQDSMSILMSFALARETKTNKKAQNGKTATTARPSTDSHPISSFATGSRDSIIRLQRAIENQAVQRFVNSNKGFEFSKINIIQPKLKISQSGDEYEQEADRVAEHVMSLSSSVHSSSFVSMATANEDERIDRKCAVCEMNKKEEENLKISRKPSNRSILEVSDQATKEINSIRSSGGTPLDANIKGFMESRFGGYDFGNVNVHTEERAARSAQNVNALAYTMGNNIVFGEGQYKPNTLEGRRLLAHELTHVVQQASNLQIISRAVALTNADYDAIAEQIHKAMSGLGTDEEAIYVSLQRLEKDPAAINNLKTRYKAKYGTELVDDIRDEMSGDELDLAIDLLGISGTPAGPPVVSMTPVSTSAQYSAAARRIYDAMSGLGTDEEAIFATLVPFNRDTSKISTLKSTYQTDFPSGITGRGLEEDLKDEMSGDELAYALYLLNAPPPATPSSSTTITTPGAEAAKGAVAGGTVSVRTGVAGTTSGGATFSGGFSLGYTGGLSSDSRWLQFIWREIIVTHPIEGTHPILHPVTTRGGHYNTTTDPSAPNYNVDSASPSSPFYEAGFRDIRTADSTTILDVPTAINSAVNSQFTKGATRVISRAHFNTFLIRDYQTLHHVYLVVEWDFTSPAVAPRVQTVRSAGSATSLPSEMRDVLIARYPTYAYIQ